jgi:hypothetical protein
MAGGPVEKFSGGRFDAVGAGTEINPVEIDGKDLILGELLFQPKGKQKFLNLASERPGRAEKKILSGLLADGTAALNNSACLYIDDHCSGDTDYIDAGMMVETPIFGGDNGLR